MKPAMKTRDLLAFPIVLLGYLFLELGVFIGGKYTSHTVLVKPSTRRSNHDEV